MAVPKILILNQPFNNDTGGGITLSNLFFEWDKNKLAVVCSGYVLSNNIDTQVCDTYYQLGHKEQKWIFPFKFFKRKYYSGLIKFDQKRIQNLTIPKSKTRVKIIMDYMYPILEYLGVLPFISKTVLSPDLCKWLKDYNPDVVYAQAHTHGDVLFCIALISYLEKPVVFHMMDDWPSTVGAKGLFRSYWQKKVGHEFKTLLNQADILMGISDYMVDEYRKRYGKSFLSFHNPIKIDFWQKHQRTSYELGETPTLLYAGRVGLGIDTSLKLIAEAVDQLNEELGMSIKFILQTQEEPSWIKNYQSLMHKSFVPYESLPKTFAESDFLIIPYDFSDESIAFIKYSMPTKASEYMASGTPIIIFAPESTAIVDYATKQHWATVITENDVTHLTLGIKDLINNRTLREKLSQTALRLAVKNHNSISVTNEFKKLICSLTHDNSITS